MKNQVPYFYKNAKILFVGINPHYGSAKRQIPFSNNKTFWYLLSRAGLVNEEPKDLKADEDLHDFYYNKFNQIYHLGFVNIIDRPTNDISELKKGEEEFGKERLNKIVRLEKPEVVVFIGKVVYEKYTGRKKFDFGWQEDINDSKAYVARFPLRGPADIRIHELQEISKAAGF